MDITKCSGVNCPFKEQCYRYTAPASDYQSYFLSPPIRDGKCDHYWGENAEQIWNQLKDTVNGREN